MRTRTTPLSKHLHAVDAVLLLLVLLFTRSSAAIEVPELSIELNEAADSLRLNWTPVPAAAGYTVWRSQADPWGAYDSLAWVSSFDPNYLELRLPVPPAGSGFYRIVADSLEGHPRLYFHACDLPAIKLRVQQPEYSVYYGHLLDRANVLKDVLPVEADSFLTFDIRHYDRQLLILAFAWLMEGDSVHLDAVDDYLEVILSYPNWATHDLSDLARAHLARAFGVCYDWLYYDLDQARLDEIIARLEYELGDLDHGDDPDGEYRRWLQTSVWYHNKPWQNHSWQALAGLGVAGLALGDVVPEANEWADFALAKSQEFEELLPPDGSWHESFTYAAYGFGPFLAWREAERHQRGTPFPDGVFFRKYPDWYVYLTRPNGQGVFTFADYSGGDRNHLEFSLQILPLSAARLGHPQAMLIYDGYEAFMGNWQANPLALLFTDHSLPTEPLEGLPLLHAFRDLGLVSVRSGWSTGSAWLCFKAGWVGGHTGNLEHTQGTGGPRMSNAHEHDDQLSFVYAVNGELFLKDDTTTDESADPPYTEYDAYRHNTITVDGQGRLDWITLRDSTQMYLDWAASDDTLRVEDNPNYTHITADASRLYPGELGLSRLRRQLVFRPEYVAVFDEVHSDSTRLVEWHFLSDAAITPESYGALFAAVSTTLRLDHGGETLSVGMIHPDHLGFAKQDSVARLAFLLHRTDQEPTLLLSQWNDSLQSQKMVVGLGLERHVLEFATDGGPFEFRQMIEP